MSVFSIRQDKIICDFGTVDSKKVPKNVPEKLVISHSKILFRIEVLMGLGLMIFPAVFFYKFEVESIILGVVITSLMGLLLILITIKKKEDHNYILDEHGFKIKDEFVPWSEVEQAIKVIPKKAKKQHEYLRLITKSKTYDIWLCSELRPRPKQLEEYVIFMMHQTKAQP
ncbi:MAG: hypothetical protein GQ574_21835 [Crocinitomix sp.]|nr:hypothetical protein [Crocinitomix sp.]